MKTLGNTGLQVSALCVGTSPLASMPGLYGYPVSEERAVATVTAVLANNKINFIDTSNGYGEDGSAERRIGLALGGRGLPANVVLATKVDPDPRTGDFSGARVRASLEESLSRLGLDRIQLLHLHDPERISFASATAPGGPVEALAELKREGLAEHLGVAGGPVGLMRQYLDTGIFEVVLTHNRYTLLDRSAAELFRDAHDRGIGVLNAAPYGGGMLANQTQQKYAYGARDERIAAAAREMRAAAARNGVPLAAAALQFSLRAPFVDATVVGVSSPSRVAETVALAETPIPDPLWAELDCLVPPSSLWLDPR